MDFSYDVPSNRIKRKANGTDSVTCIYDAMNRLTKRVQDGTVYGYTYDKRGESDRRKTVRKRRRSGRQPMCLIS
ncbi:MAG: hypothetical protein OSJ72_19375 [Lachnospiraceae bacterium]|nr:hypothetical protein [Lachnospiraceae bacterium]